MEYGHGAVQARVAPEGRTPCRERLRYGATHAAFTRPAEYTFAART